MKAAFWLVVALLGVGTLAGATFASGYLTSEARNQEQRAATRCLNALRDFEQARRSVRVPSVSRTQAQTLRTPLLSETDRQQLDEARQRIDRLCGDLGPLPIATP